jgi:phenylpropionate dioxygenase-like ring-hydroxylating dioxygenase large terminal subunit
MTEGALQAALPREMYVDQEAWLAERESVLFGQWFCVGRLDDLGLASPSRVVVVDVAGESLLVTSDEQGRLHGAYNVCRHRGSQLRPVVEAPSAAPVACEASALRCPYHSWAAHGFKFAPTFGRLLADLVIEGRTTTDLTPFRLDRPGLTDPDYHPHWLV